MTRSEETGLGEIASYRHVYRIGVPDPKFGSDGKKAEDAAPRSVNTLTRIAGNRQYSQGIRVVFRRKINPI